MPDISSRVNFEVDRMRMYMVAESVRAFHAVLFDLILQNASQIPRQSTIGNAVHLLNVV